MSSSPYVSPYVLVTPARDEEANIGRTIEAVLGQTMRPCRWVIVDDGSIDGTADIVAKAAAAEPGMALLRRPPGRSVDFASKIWAFRAGLAALGPTPHEFIGNLDADVSFGTDYFERLVERFASRPRLGLAGGSITVELGARRRAQRTAANSVAGAVQFFRRQCFDEIGGLQPLRLGGEDAAAEILARMRGWEVETFFDLPVRHHGPIHNRKRNASVAWFSRGLVNHSLGYDPLFQLLVSGYRTVDRPYVIGGTLMLAGYVTAAARRQQRAVSAEAVAFLRREQRERIRKLMDRR